MDIKQNVWQEDQSKKRDVFNMLFRNLTLLTDCFTILPYNELVCNLPQNERNLTGQEEMP